ncbi:MAG TPA: hypothetical protein VFG42_25265 [Baekduia sp.]|uniref:hypothetical protein n=1 Tax=Baekduia sp. TaxID=2600305 RepID=UPI002D79E604|nr:hypothetical protein [Baekduia sp.]HET6510126.1 hypothetical protein [Baekduia sp.]
MRRALALLVATAAAVVAPAAAPAAPPTVANALSGTAGDDGWYVGPVTITWTVTGATDSDCPAVQTLRDDTTGVSRSCSASNADGTTTVQTKTIKIDQTPPASVAGAAARTPDHGLFYTAPVAVAFSGTDATSGIASCTTATYAGPDAPSAAVPGTCRDRAGNTSAPVPFTFAYDATAPALTGVAATVGADRRATVVWTAAPDAQTVTVVRDAPAATLLDHVPAASARSVVDGPLAAGATTAYTVTIADAAGNAASATATATVPKATAKDASTAARRPTLRWRARPGAEYYNFQLYRDGRKVLSAWPRGTHYTLRARWRFHRKTYKLAAGRYRWYVWPGYGPRARHRYGRLHAKGALTYPAPPIRDGGQ